MGDIACYRPRCGHRFWIPDALEQRFRRTGETFCCPGGHAQRFTDGATPERQRIAELEDKLSSLKRALAAERGRRKDATESWLKASREVDKLRRLVWGSAAIYQCGECGHGHRWSSDVGTEHREHAVPEVSIEGDELLGVTA